MRRPQQAITEAAQRTDREELCASVRNRRHEASSFARKGQHPEATAGARSGVQPFADSAESSGSGQAQAVTGALFRAPYAICAPVFVALYETTDGGKEIRPLCAAKQPMRCRRSAIVRRNSSGAPSSRRLKKTDYCHGLLAGSDVVMLLLRHHPRGDQAGSP
jgi:hypothetical protein